MKRSLLSISALIVLVGVLSGLPVSAQEAPAMTDEHITRIKNNCQSSLAILDQIHANDAPVYINRNQTYFSISDKLMARLNSRLAFGRYDTSELVRIANGYNTELANFRATYKQYDDAMAGLVKTNCNKQPVGFYDKTGEVRGLREKVHTSIKQLHDLIGEYRTAIDQFEHKYETKLRANTND